MFISVIHEKIDQLEILYTYYVGLDNQNYLKILTKMLRLTDLSAFEKTGQFGLLFILETLNPSLRRDSNPRPCAPQLNHYTTIPNVLVENSSKIFERHFKRFLQSFSGSVASRICNNRQFLLKRQKTRISNNF